jgi:hypothetical protein
MDRYCSVPSQLCCCTLPFSLPTFYLHRTRRLTCLAVHFSLSARLSAVVRVEQANRHMYPPDSHGRRSTPSTHMLKVAVPHASLIEPQSTRKSLRNLRLQPEYLISSEVPIAHCVAIRRHCLNRVASMIHLARVFNNAVSRFRLKRRIWITK